MFSFPPIRSHVPLLGPGVPLPGRCVLPGYRPLSRAVPRCPAPPARLGFLLAQRVPALAGASQLAASSRVAAGRCLVPRQALGFVTHGRAPRRGIASAPREGAACPGWVRSAPAGLTRWGAAGPWPGRPPPQLCQGPEAGSSGQGPRSCCSSTPAAGNRLQHRRGAPAPRCPVRIARGLPERGAGRLGSSGLCGEQAAPSTPRLGARQHPAPHASLQPLVSLYAPSFYAGEVATQPPALDA